MKRTDFIPTNDNLFYRWVNNFLEALGVIFARVGFPETVLTRLKDLRDTFNGKLLVAETPGTRTKAAIQEKNDARKVLEAEVRQAYGEYLRRNHLLTDADRDNLGLPIPKTTRTPAPVATTHPDFDVDSSMIRRLIVHFFDQGSKKSKAKPAGQHGAEIRWAILDTPPASIEELIFSSFDTRTPFTLSFDENQRGETVYFCLRWENTRGEKGPWSTIVSAIIP
jgi:hypothetical protein